MFWAIKVHKQSVSNFDLIKYFSFITLVDSKNCFHIIVNFFTEQDQIQLLLLHVRELFIYKSTRIYSYG